MAIADWTLNPYPAPRNQRSVPSGAVEPAGDVELTRAPRVRLWSFHLAGAANRTIVLGSPKFRGPALIKDLTGSSVTGGTIVSSDMHVQLFVAAGPATRHASVGITEIQAGINQTESGWMDDAAVQSGSGAHGIIWKLDGAGAQMFTQPLSIPVYDTDFWLTLALRNAHTTNRMTLDGVIRVYEDCDLDAIPLLMG